MTFYLLCIWAVVGPSAGFLLASFLFSAREKHHPSPDFISALRRAHAGRDWPPIPSDDCMHGSAL